MDSNMHEGELPEQPATEPQSKPERVAITCHCGREYSFDLEKEDGRVTTQFTFICQGCGTTNTWNR